MKDRLDRKEALEIVKKKAKECIKILESTAFLFHSYRDDIIIHDAKEDILNKEEKISYVYIGHLKAMAMKIVESFDRKSESIQDFIIAYEAIKALIVAIDKSMKTSSSNNNGKKSCLVLA